MEEKELTLQRLWKEFQGFKARQEEISRKQGEILRLNNRRWQERMVFVSTIVGLVVALVIMV